MGLPIVRILVLSNTIALICIGPHMLMFSWNRVVLHYNEGGDFVTPRKISTIDNKRMATSRMTFLNHIQLQANAQALNPTSKNYYVKKTMEPRTCSTPLLFMVPPITLSSSLLATGWASDPVIILSFTKDWPHTTTPSVGTLDPGTTFSIERRSLLLSGEGQWFPWNSSKSRWTK